MGGWSHQCGWDGTGMRAICSWKSLVSEKMVSRSVCVKEEKKEGTRCWRKMRNEELHSLYVSPNIITVITSRTMRWADRWKDNLKERRGCWKFKEGALGRTVWRIHCGKVCGPVVSWRLRKKWMRWVGSVEFENKEEKCMWGFCGKSWRSESAWNV
jgi:hypothetical protein